MKRIDEITFYRATGEYGFMSNLYKREVVFSGIKFRSSEDAYQFGKPKDKEVAHWIVSAPKPHLCAIAAHALLPWDIRPGWNDGKVERMKLVLCAKFTQHDDLKEKLLATGDAQLTEVSKSDAFWGTGKKGNGKNMLGKLLMELREELREVAA